MQQDPLQGAIDRLTDRIEELIRSLPDTYVSIRFYDKQIAELIARLVTLEEYNKRGTQWANDVHTEMKAEWNENIKEINEKLSVMQTGNFKMWMGIGVQVILMLVGFIFTYFHH